MRPVQFLCHTCWCWNCVQIVCALCVRYHYRHSLYPIGCTSNSCTSMKEPFSFFLVCTVLSLWRRRTSMLAAPFCFCAYADTFAPTRVYHIAWNDRFSNRLGRLLILAMQETLLTFNYASGLLVISDWRRFTLGSSERWTISEVHKGVWRCSSCAFLNNGRLTGHCISCSVFRFVVHCGVGCYSVRLPFSSVDETRR